MPRPVGRETTYLPGLDGVRAIAVAAVVGYHVGVPHLDGGLLGVGVFFTLSGYLITSILLTTWDRTGGLDLRHFWLRRARRLLPAVVLVLVVVLAGTAIADPSAFGKRAGQAAGAIFYVANWQTIANGTSYFQRFAGPGPLDHLWSLSVEEQFYLVWPLLLLLLLAIFLGRLRRIAITTLVLAAVSFVVLYLLSAPGFDNTRAYEGTDARAGGLLIGAALAMVWRPGRQRRDVGTGSRLVIDGTGLAALAVIALLVVTTNEYSLSLYSWGILALSLATAALLAVVVHPASLVGRVIGMQPLRWIGERSYGIYLWHLPVIAFTPQEFLAERPVVRGVLQVALTVLLAALSWVLVEDPIRRRGLLAALRRDGHPTADGRRRRVPALVTGALVIALLGTASLAATAATAPGADQTDPGDAGGLEPPLPPKETPTPTQEPSKTPGHRGDDPTPTPTPTTPSVPVTTSCESVVHIGDSTSIGLMDKNYLPKKSDRINVQYRKVGAKDVQTDISGARSIVETWHGFPNAQTAVRERIDKGYNGCWVVAMGTNDTANQAAGSNVDSDQRIDLLMQAIGDHPTMWLTVRTLRTSGPYAEKQMQKWDDALVRACTRYPQMRVYDWAAQVKDSWFIDDKIHFTTPGYRERASRTARALATAFPTDGVSPTECLVTPPD